MRKIIFIFAILIIATNYLFSQTKIVEYEYWFNEDFSSKIVKQVTPAEVIEINEDLDLSNLPTGFHLINFRFKDSDGNWSIAQSKNIFKAGKGSSDENLVIEYRYWINESISNAVNVRLDKPIKLFELTTIIDMPFETGETLNIQFKDTAGLWSVVYTRVFLPEAVFEMYNTINTFTFQNKSVFGSKFSWDFGDNKKSNEVSPSHTYEKPGVYNVRLIAENKLGKDTATSKIVIEGIREIISNNGGNTGDVSVFVYGGGLIEGTEIWLSKEGEDDIKPLEITFPLFDALRVKFDLRDKVPGIWNVVAKMPNGNIYTLNNSFTIQSGGVASPYARLSGRSRILFNRWQTYSIIYGNTGNVDATGVPIWIAIPDIEGVEIEFLDFEISWSQYAIDKGYNSQLSDLPLYVRTDSIEGKPFKAKVYPLYIPSIPAGINDEVRIRLKSPTDLDIQVWINEPYFHSPMSVEMGQCVLSVIGEGVIDIGTSAIPVIGCIHSAGKFVYNPYESYRPNKPKTWGSLIWNLGVTVLDCGVNLSGAGAVAKGIAVFGANMYNYYSSFMDCKEAYEHKSKFNRKIPAVWSFDPNEIVGPIGFTEKNYTKTQSLSYSIYFENKADATAPAQEVVIIDTIDASKFEFSSFSFGQFSFGGEFYSPLTGVNEFTMDIKESKNTNNIIRVNAKFDSQTGVAYWQFITLDPKTMDLTEDPFGGFLPPNKTSPEGEGSVSYHINRKTSLQNDESIKAKAEIYFDLNEPIITNEYSNSLDFEAPISKLTDIQSTWEKDYYRFYVDKYDKQSGVKNITLYASKNDSAYYPVYFTNENPFYFKCEPGIVYKFFSIAEDNLGNIESMKNDLEVSTLKVSVDDNINRQISFNVLPNPAKYFIEITIEGLRENSTLLLYNALGSQVADLTQNLTELNGNKIIFKTDDLSTGSYNLVLTTRFSKIAKQILIVK